MTQRSTVKIAICAALFLVMSAVIISGLNDESLWGDEGWSVRFSDGESPRDVTLAVADDRHPPLYFVGLWGWRHAAGEDEIALRFLGFFASLLAGALIFRLGQDLFGTASGLAALLIFVLLDKQVTFSQEVRHYPWLIMWTTASLWALIRWKRKATRGSSFFYAATIIGGLYTHSFMFVILLIHALYAALTIRRALWRELLALWLLAGIAFAPWAMVFVYQYRIHGELHHEFPLTREIMDILITDFLGKPVALFAGLLLLGIASPILKKHAQPPKRDAVLLPMIALAVPLLIIFGIRPLHLLTDRNLAIVIPALALLIGLGLTSFGGYARAALVIFLLVNGLFTTDANMHNPPWRPISRYVGQHQIDGQPVVLDVGGEDAALSYHLDADIPQISILQLRQDDLAEPLTALRFEKIGAADGFWYIQWNDDPEFINAFMAWGYTRSAFAQDAHLGGPIYLHRYDSLAILDEQVAVFGDVLVLNRVALPGDDGVVGLWWEVISPMEADVTVSVFLLDAAGQVITQHDSPPQDGHAHTSEWLPDTLYFDAHRLSLLSGDYQLGVRVYLSSDGTNLPTETGAEYFSAGSVEVSNE